MHQSTARINGRSIFIYARNERKLIRLTFLSNEILDRANGSSLLFLFFRVIVISQLLKRSNFFHSLKQRSSSGSHPLPLRIPQQDVLTFRAAPLPGIPERC